MLHYMSMNAFKGTRLSCNMPGMDLGEAEVYCTECWC